MKEQSSKNMASSTEHKSVVPDEQSSGLDHKKVYYRRLRRGLGAGLMLAFMVPLIILSFYFHFQFNHTLKKNGKLHLVTIAESQRNTVDLFLQERVMNVLNLFNSTEFTLAPSKNDMRCHLESLLIMSDAFVDVGFLDDGGIQIGYAGPYPHLRGRDYHGETWFETLTGGKKNYHISDIYLGFREKPHYTIAVRQIIDGRYYVMRATLDPDKLYLFLQTIGRGKSVSSTLVNRAGKYQSVDPDTGLMEKATEDLTPETTGSGVTEIGGAVGRELVAYAWLDEVPWALVVRQPLSIAYAEMYRARLVLIVTMVVFVAVLYALTWFTTSRLLTRAEATDESRAEIRSQLYHAASLASVGELAGGVAHEINNPLQVIATQSGLIKDMLNPEFGMDAGREELVRELDIIDEAVYRTRDITTKLLNFVRKNEPELVPCNINDVLDDVVSGLIVRELEVREIELVRDYGPNPPEVLLDPNQLRQVFLNMVNNAGDAIEGPGKITLATRHDDEFIRVTISDTGKGMTPEQQEQVFIPFFTTKEVGKGTGLGLSVSLSIVESMGGHIEFQSVPGAGTSFTVFLPLRRVGEKEKAESS